MDNRHTFLTTQGHEGPPRMSDQPNAGATSETAQTWKTIHTKHTLSHPNKANMEWWLRRPNDIRVLGGLKFADICLTGEEKPRKNLTQETCPNRGSNPGPLHDKRACYHLLHSSELANFLFGKMFGFIEKWSFVVTPYKINAFKTFLMFRFFTCDNSESCY